MAFITDWIKNIILFILLATVMDMLLPKSSFQKYVKMVTGLLLLMVVFQPIMQLINRDFDDVITAITIPETKNDENIENLIEMKKKEIQASQHAYILEQMAVQMETDIQEELVQEYGLKVEDVILSVEENGSDLDLTNQNVNVQVVVSEGRQENAVAVVKPITIDTNQPHEPIKNKEDYSPVLKFLSIKWGVDESKISIHVKGGED
ncbi:stage III sporulation protein AF [Bacillus sp. HMF5848]|uniref:stage III sporulation protein AF n=1 Tax=Bacillus sp. HMF5848 TaxID=2495421 RepID=UPI000F78E1BF|nr:stage III sporulation protein AF [Bacillus sp. HMF5848]RSK27801.1 stage III sporulation protein AF [Bacillus sp. HMF5848]